MDKKAELEESELGAAAQTGRLKVCWCLTHLYKGSWDQLQDTDTDWKLSEDWAE